MSLGPNAFVGSDCVLESGCIVRDSVVLSGSYVGEAVNLDGVVVDRGRLVNYRLGAVLTVGEDFLLGSMHKSSLAVTLNRLGTRILAAVLLAAGLPLLALTALWLLASRGRVVHSREVVRLPARPEGSAGRTYRLLSFLPDGDEAHGVRHFLLCFLPGLIHVVRGELGFVGVRTQTPAEADRLEGEWRRAYLGAGAGLITENCLRPHALDDEEEHACDAVCAARLGFRYALGLAGRYAVAVLASPFRRQPVAVVAEGSVPCAR